MSFMKCFDAVTMVTDEATKQFGSLLQEDADKKLALQESCELIESLANQFGGVAYETEVDDETTEISVGLTCEEFETDATSSKLYELLERAKKVEFKTSDNEHIEIVFTFGGIWTSTM